MKIPAIPKTKIGNEYLNICFNNTKLAFSRNPGIISGTNTQMGLPREYVTAGKQARIRKTALFYLCDNGLDCPARFDVAEVYAAAPGDEKSVRIVYVEDAFQ